MRFNELRSIGHNNAYSLARGCGSLIGAYGWDVFEEAARSAEGSITVDFLAKTCTGGEASRALADAVVLYREGVAILGAKQGRFPIGLQGTHGSLLDRSPWSSPR
jgi:hypothetical protein